MDKLQRLLLLFCCGCILYGLLENLLPKKGVFAAVKAAAVLYLILLVLSAGQGQMTFSFFPDAFSDAVPPLAFEADAAAVNEKTAVVLRERLADALRESGLACELTAVRLPKDETESDGVTLTVLAQEQDREKIRCICDGMLGFAAAYIWTGE